MQTGGTIRRAGVVGATSAWVLGGGAALAVLILAVLVAGPAPVRGTRWFWFWLIYAGPYGLGMVFWLLRDRPWSTTTQPAQATGGTERGTADISAC